MTLLMQGRRMSVLMVAPEEDLAISSALTSGGDQLDERASSSMVTASVSLGPSAGGPTQALQARIRSADGSAP